MIKSWHKGLDVQQRCAIQHVQSSHPDDAAIDTENLQTRQADRVGAKWRMSAEYPHFCRRCEEVVKKMN